MKAAVIGCGIQGRGGHIVNYNKMNDIDLVAVCDANFDKAQAVATEFYIPNAYSDYRELLDKHDERGETNQLIKMKIKSSLNQNMNVIFCIGETLKEKKKRKTFSVIRNQIKKSLENKLINNKIILAYEPVWSIGTNKILNMKDLQNVIRFIKNDFKKNFTTRISPKVLYGGSVNSQNIKLLSSIPEIDGFLIGGASQSAKKFIDIIRNYYK